MSAKKEPTMQEAAAAWRERSWASGTADWHAVKKRKPSDLNGTIEELFVRQSYADAALREVFALVKDYPELKKKMADFEVKQTLLDERLASSQQASTSRRNSDDEDEETFGVIKNMSMMESMMAARNDFSWLPGIEEGDIAFQREWNQPSGGWSAVVLIAEGRRSKVFKAAKQWKGSGEGLTAVLVPYLSRATMRLRQDRTDVFRSLAEAGAKPKWDGIADIRYTDERGLRRLYDF